MSFSWATLTQLAAATVRNLEASLDTTMGIKVVDGEGTETSPTPEGNEFYEGPTTSSSPSEEGETQNHEDERDDDIKSTEPGPTRSLMTREGSSSRRPSASLPHVQTGSPVKDNNKSTGASHSNQEERNGTVDPVPAAESTALPTSSPSGWDVSDSAGVFFDDDEALIDAVNSGAVMNDEMMEGNTDNIPTRIGEEESGANNVGEAEAALAIDQHVESSHVAVSDTFTQLPEDQNDRQSMQHEQEEGKEGDNGEVDGMLVDVTGRGANVTVDPSPSMQENSSPEEVTIEHGEKGSSLTQPDRDHDQESEDQGISSGNDVDNKNDNMTVTTQDNANDNSHDVSYDDDDWGDAFQTSTVSPETTANPVNSVTYEGVCNSNSSINYNTSQTPPADVEHNTTQEDESTEPPSLLQDVAEMTTGVDTVGSQEGDISNEPSMSSSLPSQLSKVVATPATAITNSLSTAMKALSVLTSPLVGHGEHDSFVTKDSDTNKTTPHDEDEAAITSSSSSASSSSLSSSGEFTQGENGAHGQMGDESNLSVNAKDDDDDDDEIVIRGDSDERTVSEKEEADVAVNEERERKEGKEGGDAGDRASALPFITPAKRPRDSSLLSQSSSKAEHTGLRSSRPSGLPSTNKKKQAHAIDDIDGARAQRQGGVPGGDDMTITLSYHHTGQEDRNSEVRETRGQGEGGVYSLPAEGNPYVAPAGIGWNGSVSAPTLTPSKYSIYSGSSTLSNFSVTGALAAVGAGGEGVDTTRLLERVSRALKARESHLDRKKKENMRLVETVKLLEEEKRKAEERVTELMNRIKGQEASITEGKGLRAMSGVGDGDGDGDGHNGDEITKGIEGEEQQGTNRALEIEKMMHSETVQRLTKADAKIKAMEEMIQSLNEMNEQMKIQVQREGKKGDEAGRMVAEVRAKDKALTELRMEIEKLVKENKEKDEGLKARAKELVAKEQELSVLRTELLGKDKEINNANINIRSTQQNLLSKSVRVGELEAMAREAEARAKENEEALNKAKTAMEKEMKETEQRMKKEKEELKVHYEEVVTRMEEEFELERVEWNKMRQESAKLRDELVDLGEEREMERERVTNEYKEQITKLTAQRNTLEETIMRLREEKKAMEDDMAKVLKEGEEARTQVSEMTKQVTVLTEKIGQLETALSLAHSHNEELSSLHRDSQEEYRMERQSLTVKLDEATAKVDELQSALVETTQPLLRQIKDLSAQITSLKQDSTMKEVLARTRQEELENEIASTVAEKRELSDRLTKSKGRVQEVEAMLQLTRTTLAETDAKVTALNKEKETLSEKVGALGSKVSVLERKLGELEEENDRLRDEVTQKQDEVTALKQRTQYLGNMHYSMNGHISGRAGSLTPSPGMSLSFHPSTHASHPASSGTTVAAPATLSHSASAHLLALKRVASPASTTGGLNEEHSTAHIAGVPIDKNGSHIEGGPSVPNPLLTSDDITTTIDVNELRDKIIAEREVNRTLSTELERLRLLLSEGGTHVTHTPHKSPRRPRMLVKRNEGDGVERVVGDQDEGGGNDDHDDDHESSTSSSFASNALAEAVYGTDDQATTKVIVGDPLGALGQDIAEEEEDDVGSEDTSARRREGDGKGSGFGDHSYNRSHTSGQNNGSRSGRWTSSGGIEALTSYRAHVRRLEGELQLLRERLHEVEASREAMTLELVEVRNKAAVAERRLAALEMVETEVGHLRLRYDAAVEVVGEKEDELIELRSDLEHVKATFREQVTELLQTIADLKEENLKLVTLGGEGGGEGREGGGERGGIGDRIDGSSGEGGQIVTDNYDEAIKPSSHVKSR